MIRKLKAALVFLRHIPWVDAPDWTVTDARALQAFLATPTGVKFRAELLNRVVRSQASAVSAVGPHQPFECGVAVGLRTGVQSIEWMADDSKFTADEGTEPAPADE